MESSSSRLLPSVPKTKPTTKRPLEIDGDSSSSDDDIYNEDDSSLGRDAKNFYREVARQCSDDFQKEKRDAMDKLKSNVHKFSLGKKMCAFIWQTGPMKDKRCEKQRSGKHGKYCSSDHQRQVKRRGKRIQKKKIAMPSGATIYLDAAGNAHCQPQLTPQEQQLYMLLNQLKTPSNSTATLSIMPAAPTAPAPTLAITAPAPMLAIMPPAPTPPPKPAHLASAAAGASASADSALDARFEKLTGFKPVYQYSGSMPSSSPMEVDDGSRQPLTFPNPPQNFPTYHFT